MRGWKCWGWKMAGKCGGDLFGIARKMRGGGEELHSYRTILVFCPSEARKREREKLIWAKRLTYPSLDVKNQSEARKREREREKLISASVFSSLIGTKTHRWAIV